MPKKLLQNDSFNLLMVNGGGSAHDYTAIPPIQIEDNVISLEESTVSLINSIENKLYTSAFSNVSGTFATTSQIYTLSASTANLYNSIDTITTNTSNIFEKLQELSGKYTQTNENLTNLQSDYDTFTTAVNDYFYDNNNNITEISGDIYEIKETLSSMNNFTGVFRDYTLEGDGLNSPLGVKNHISDDLYDMLSALSSVLVDSAQHPNAVLGTTATETGTSFGWIDLG
jgi:hypothetical protein